MIITRTYVICWRILKYSTLLLCRVWFSIKAYLLLLCVRLSILYVGRTTKVISSLDGLQNNAVLHNNNVRIKPNGIIATHIWKFNPIENGNLIDIECLPIFFSPLCCPFILILRSNCRTGEHSWNIQAIFAKGSSCVDFVYLFVLCSCVCFATRSQLHRCLNFKVRIVCASEVSWNAVFSWFSLCKWMLWVYY